MEKDIGEVERMIIDGINNGFTQKQIAHTYSLIIQNCGDGADWPLINRAITARWKGKTALKRVKEMAWRHVRQQPEATDAG